MMKSLLRAAACLLVALGLPLHASAAAFLWEVSSMTNKVYLYGTVHAGKAEWYPLPSVVEQAFADSEALVVEADISDVDAIRKSQPATFIPPDTLAKHVDPADYERFRKLLPRFSLPEAQARQMRPFMAVSLLVFGEWARLGYKPAYAVEAYLIGKAQQAKKPVRELEGIEAQVDMIDSLTEDQNRRIFEGTVEALDSGLVDDQIRGMVKAWQEGDPKALLEVAHRYNEKVKGAAELEEKFVWSRHDAMAKKIESYLNESKDRCFVAVGALHLAGPRGLVEMLRKRGYIVRQLGS
ncbi:MAG TPA: TraB/GumN family protein [Usitatibacter sp.]|nr:TraB/GumN family protein [Usitatibacter sp.]